MAEKRGQYQYNDDGSISQLVHNTNETAENSVIATDKQAQLKQQIESNTTPLGISATYTGASFDTMADGVNFNWLTGHCVANQAGNLYIEHSGDGTNWERLDTIGLNASTPVKINIDVLSRYVRFVIVNGATAQTILRLFAFATFK